MVPPPPLAGKIRESILSAAGDKRIWGYCVGSREQSKGPSGPAPSTPEKTWHHFERETRFKFDDLGGEHYG
jgi:hypothetical protein